MSSIQEYTYLLTKVAQQREEWSVTADKPFTISRQHQDNALPLAISVHGNESKAHLFINLYDDSELADVAQKFLRIKREKLIQHKDDSGLVIYIDEEGFAVVYDVTDVSTEEFSAQFDNIIDNAEELLSKSISYALEDLKSASNESNRPIEQVVEQYLEKKYKFQHDEDGKRFILGFATDSYINKEGDKSLLVAISYADKERLCIQTPLMYIFDLNKTDYSLIAMVIAWYQFEYKFLSMSLDPEDGELKISIDLPLGQGTLHHSQIDRIVSFIQQFSEETYSELFSLLLTDSDSAKKILNEKIDEHKANRRSRSWLQSIQKQLTQSTDEQKAAIQKILSQGKSTNEQGGI
ncbi:hypothetical protein [Shewanella baltica]|uniref:hypothetical protein n=1 Tax=Shewanella baltica TaxID=62322 RepID=UPI00217D2CE5|nr:hypothetical protein [Shewanella baltica]MCS6100984.1 hypothetical protein [Shewanella baltica]MCS6184072.1 hypothetical protein [Shewanella baltica]